MPGHRPQEVHVLFLDAFNRGDVEGLVALYEPNALFVTRCGVAVGHEAIREAYQHILAGGGHMELETRTVLEFGEGLAMLHATWIYHRAGDARYGLSTEVARRQSNGAWLFVIDEPRTPESENRK